jgi:hypothetical protein
VEAAVWRNEEAANEKKKRFSTLASTRAVASHVAILSTLCFCELSADNNKKCFQIVKKTIPRKKDEKAFFCLPNKYAIEISPFQTFKILTRALQMGKDVFSAKFFVSLMK